MKAVLQHYNTGVVSVTEIPTPAPTAGTITVATAASLISAGTERAMLTIAKKSLVSKALSRPDWTNQVIDKVKSDGIMETYRQVRARLDLPIPLGYSSAGVVKEVGAGVTRFAAGDRVACAGYPYATHGEIVRVPQNLCVHVLDHVSFADASYVMLGAIALNAVRLAEPQLGERVAVIGLGLLGLLAVQILRAAGCLVIGVDVSPEKLELARELGATYATLPHHAAGSVTDFTGKIGVDSSLVFASADTSQPLDQAAEITRERGRVVVPGLVKLDVPRKAFFEKELQLIVPRAGGPGSGDAAYESGHDYPQSLVRWTEGRNLSAFMDLINDGRVRVSPLTTHRFPIEHTSDAYRLLNGEVGTSHAPIGIIITYPENGQHRAMPVVRTRSRVAGSVGELGVGLIGAGLFARGVLLPLLKSSKGIRLRGVAASSGTSARHAAEKGGFEYCTTDYREILADSSIHAVLISTRHGLHAQMTSEALDAGKHVLVEKPLAITEQQLRTVLEAASRAPNAILMVGFNRRFAPATRRLLEELGRGPLAIHCRINAGAVPLSSWVQDPDEGGGRIVGEVCHFVDLVHTLARGLTCSVSASAMRENDQCPTQDTIGVVLQLDNGSIGSIVYVANGDKSFPRERIEVFSAGAVGVIENFRSCSITAGGKTRKFSRLAMDRGHDAELHSFFEAIRKGRPPVSVEDYATTTLTTFRIQEALSTRSFPTYNLSAIPQHYRGRFFFEEEMSGMRILRIAAPGKQAPSKLARAWAHLVSPFLYALRALRMDAVDTVFTVSPPLFMGLSASVVAARFGAPYCLAVQDMFPKNAIDLGLLRNRPLIRLLEATERATYRSAAAITVHSNGNRRHVISRGGSPNRVHVVPNWVDTDWVRPGDRDNEVRRKAGVHSDFLVVFAGTMGWSQGLSVVVDAARELAAEPDLKFLLVGDGIERGRLESRASGLPNVRFLPMQPKEMYPFVLAAADACLVTLRPEVTTPVVPSKLLTIMAAQRPVLASLPIGGDAPAIISESGCGITCSPGDVRSLVQAVLRLKNNPEEAREMAVRGRRFAVRNFSRIACVRRYEDVFEEARRAA